MKRAILTAVLLQSQGLLANDIFEYQGPYARANGGAGLILGRSGSAVLDNPANLGVSGSSNIYFDTAPTNLTYQLTTPDPKVKPGKISVPILPLTSIGGSYSDGKAPMCFGFIFIPTGFGRAVEVKDFPVAINGQYQTANIIALQKGYKLGVGGSYRFGEKTYIGLSIMNNSAGSNTRVVSNGQELIKISSDLSSLHFTLGVRYEWDGFASLVASYRPAADMHYNLKLAALGSETQSFYRRDYRPTVYGAGAMLNSIGIFQPFVQYTRETWVPATLYAQAPTQAVGGTAPIEYLNTNNFVLGSRYVLPSTNILSVALSSYSKNKAAGVKNAQGVVVMQGRGAQDFEALDRKHYTLGYEWRRSSSDILLYGSYIRATALSGEDTPSAGFYELTAYMLGFGYVQR